MIDSRRIRQLGRLVRYYFMVCSRRGVHPLQAAEQLGVTERTIYRYLEALRYAKVPVYYDRDRRVHCVIPGWRPENIAWAAGEHED